MKTFYAALAVFAAMLGLIVWNALHIHTTAAELTARLDAMPSCTEAQAEVESLAAYWEQKRGLVALSTLYGDVTALDNCIAEMRVAIALGEETDFAQNRALAYNAVARIRRVEQVSLDSIL